jgi:hypothetical protein
VRNAVSGFQKSRINPFLELVRRRRISRRWCIRQTTWSTSVNWWTEVSALVNCYLKSA